MRTFLATLSSSARYHGRPDDRCAEFAVLCVHRGTNINESDPLTTARHFAVSIQSLPRYGFGSVRRPGCQRSPDCVLKITEDAIVTSESYPRPRTERGEACTPWHARYSSSHRATMVTRQALTVSETNLPPCHGLAEANLSAPHHIGRPQSIQSPSRTPDGLQPGLLGQAPQGWPAFVEPRPDVTSNSETLQICVVLR